MKATLEIYKDRIDEIDLYFNALKDLYATQPQEKKVAFYTDDFLKILKANALIMIYNLVESSIMGGILEIYDALKSSGYCYKDVRKEIQDIWFSFKFNQVYDKNAHYNSYRDKAAEIINAIIQNDALIMDRKATDIRGNLDADKIRQICKQHGITYKIDAKCKGGAVLEDVKNKRNDLAHGTMSFAECGRYYAIDDLEKVKNETIIFLDGILHGMKKYYDDRTFLASAVNE